MSAFFHSGHVCFLSFSLSVCLCLCLSVSLSLSFLFLPLCLCLRLSLSVSLALALPPCYFQSLSPGPLDKIGLYISRPVAIPPGGGGGGLNLDGWNTIYRVWLGCLYHGRNKESSSNRRGWLISHSGAYFHL